MTILEEVAFISFLSFYTVWFGYNFGQTLQWSRKATDSICYRQTVNLAFI